MCDRVKFGNSPRRTEHFTKYVNTIHATLPSDTFLNQKIQFTLLIELLTIYFLV